jgi:CheY-like chemotaxis protein
MVDRDSDLKILIVEDQYLISLQLSHILKSLGPTVSILTAQNGQEGVDRFFQTRPDLIITDLAMPKMDGYDMVKKIRDVPEGQAIPIIGISASDPADVRAGAFQRLCDDYLEKPFYQRDVLQKVGALLGLNERTV